MRPYGSRPGIPSPVGVDDPVARRALLAIKEAIEGLTHELEEIKRQLNPGQQPALFKADALPQQPPTPPRFSRPDTDPCGND